MPTLTTAARDIISSPEAGRPRREKPSIYARYVGAMLYFVGAALIAGAVVHYPLDPPVYAGICIVGALVFLLGTVVNEFVFAAERPVLRRAIALVTFSLLLSFGVGMLGGGIQHFEAFPERSAAMTPIGLLMSYAAFIAKDPEGRWRHLVSVFGAGVVAVAALSWLGMSALADSMSAGSHGHHTSTVPSENPPAKQAEEPADGTNPPARELKVREEDGHDSHDH